MRIFLCVRVRDLEGDELTAGGARRVARAVTVGEDGAVWLLTNLTVYRTLDRNVWEAALVGAVVSLIGSVK